MLPFEILCISEPDKLSLELQIIHPQQEFTILKTLNKIYDLIPDCDILLTDISKFYQHKIVKGMFNLYDNKSSATIIPCRAVGINTNEILEDTLFNVELNFTIQEECNKAKQYLMSIHYSIEYPCNKFLTVYCESMNSKEYSTLHKNISDSNGNAMYFQIQEIEERKFYNAHEESMKKFCHNRYYLESIE